MNTVIPKLKFVFNVEFVNYITTTAKSNVFREYLELIHGCKIEKIDLVAPDVELISIHTPDNDKVIIIIDKGLNKLIAFSSVKYTKIIYSLFSMSRIPADYVKLVDVNLVS